MVLFRIIKNLIKLALRLLWLPLFLLARNVYVLAVVAILVVLYMKYEHAEPPAQVAPAGIAAAPVAQQHPTDTKKNRREAAPPVIEAVTKRENGDSAFATDLYTLMDDDQRAHYSHYYYWAMNHATDGQPQPWANGNTHGSFTPTRTFTNASGGTCRNFAETLKVRYIEQQLTGVACLKPDNTWCKLRPNATPACGLGGQRGFWERVGSWF